MYFETVPPSKSRLRQQLFLARKCLLKGFFVFEASGAMSEAEKAQTAEPEEVAEHSVFEFLSSG